MTALPPRPSVLAGHQVPLGHAATKICTERVWTATSFEANVCVVARGDSALDVYWADVCVRGRF